jgi:hypothetical protein
VKNLLPDPRRTLAALVVALPVVVFGPVGSAAAHVEVQAVGEAQAGTGPVTVLFMAESESQTAGIVRIKTQLPAGIEPDDVTLISGPDGWTLTATDDGFELGGPDVGPGMDVEFSVSIAVLPADTTELPFKTLQFYSDGREDAWIELPTESSPEPEMAAPILTVAPAPAGATTAPTASAPQTTASASTIPSSPSPTDTAAADDDGSSAVTMALLVGALAAVALGGGVWVWRSRRSE